MWQVKFSFVSVKGWIVDPYEDKLLWISQFVPLPAHSVEVIH